MKLFAISTGHSNFDPGAISRIDGTKEFDLNVLLVNEMLKHPLKNAKWVLIDSVCEDFGYPKHLTCTVQQINTRKDIIGCVELHHNAAWNQNISGGMALYWDPSIHGKMLSDFISFQLNYIMFFNYSGFKFHWRTVQHKHYKSRSLPTVQHIKRRLYYLRKTNIPACIIEPGYISNKHDLEFVQKYRQAIAWSIWKGIDAWVNLKTDHN